MLVKGKKSLQAIKILIYSFFIVIFILVNMVYIVSVKTVHYDDRELLANITMSNFVKDCLKNNTVLNPKKSTDGNNKLKCLNPPENIYFKAESNDGNTFVHAGNTSLRNKIVYCSSGSFACMKEQYPVYIKKKCPSCNNARVNYSNLHLFNATVVVSTGK